MSSIYMHDNVSIYYDGQEQGGHEGPAVALERIYPFTKLKTKHHYRLLFVVNGNCRHHKDCWTWKWKLVAVYESVVIQILLMRWIDFFTNKHGCFQKHHTFTI